MKNNKSIFSKVEKKKAIHDYNSLHIRIKNIIYDYARAIEYNRILRKHFKITPKQYNEIIDKYSKETEVPELFNIS